jgi:regulator of protease activity HflC (stomatin/prohibitin superfamily)
MEAKSQFLELYVDMLTSPWFSLALLLILISVIATLGCFVVEEKTVVIVERLGRYHRQLQPGFYILIPGIDRVKSTTWLWKVESEKHKIIWRPDHFTAVPCYTRIYDFAPIPAWTKDKIQLVVDGLLHYHIENPKNAMYGGDVGKALSLWIDSVLCQTVAQFTYEELQMNPSLIHQYAFKQIEDQKERQDSLSCESLGIILKRLDIQSLLPPEEIRDNFANLSKEIHTIQARKKIQEKELEHNLAAFHHEIRRREMDLKWELETYRKRSEYQAQAYKILRDAGQSDNFMIKMDQNRLLCSASSQNHIIIPHDLFRADSANES